MNEFTKQALTFLHSNWGTVLESGASAADAIGVNQNTLRARIKAGKAMVMRGHGERVRASIDYTGQHLVWNMIFDRLAKFGIQLDDDPKSPHVLHTYVEEVYKNVVDGEMNVDTFMRVELREGRPVVHWFKDADEMGQFSGEAALVLPIGTMVARLAAKMFMQHSYEAASLVLKAD